MKKILGVGTVALLLSGLFVLPAQADVSMEPAVSRVGSVEHFKLGLSSDREMSTTMIRLVIPSGVSDVKPNVKPGWIARTEQADGEQSLVWLGGLIPAGQRDDFVFSAQLPGSGDFLAWKIYQTYGDGTVISWVLDPRSIPAGFVGVDRAEAGPYPLTALSEPLAASASEQLRIWSDPQITFFLSLLALVISLISFNVHHEERIRARRRK